MNSLNFNQIKKILDAHGIIYNIINNDFYCYCYNDNICDIIKFFNDDNQYFFSLYYMSGKKSYVCSLKNMKLWLGYWKNFLKKIIKKCWQK